MIWPFTHVIEALQVARADRLFPERIAGGVPVQHPIFGTLALRALEVAETQLGLDEDGRNGGPHVARWVAPAKPPQNYCAGFAGWCYEEAARQLSIALPFKRSLGAKRLGANVAAVGRRFTDPAEARAGDLMVFHRGAQGSWMGHVAMVSAIERELGAGLDSRDPASWTPVVATVEGNAGPKVMRKVRRVDRDRFSHFASVRR
jgi:hypothetical protein